MLKRCVLGVGILTAVSSFAASSRASDVVCGSTSAAWNVPNGATAFTQTEGPIKSVVAGIGEYRTHSMLSNGPGGWVTHATSTTPGMNGDRSPYLTPFCSSCGSECWNPIDPNFLYNSTPGLEQVTQGAIYTFLFKGGTNNYLTYQRGNTAANQAAVGNYSWSGGNGTGFKWMTSTTDGSQGYYGVTYNGTQVHYGWNQYMNQQGAAQGVPGSNTGEVCSTSLAMWQHDALSAGGVADMQGRTYQPATITNAANALYNSVYSECYSQNGPWASIGSFLQSIGYGALCLGYGDGNPCDEAADQMVNCFASGHCGDTSRPGNYNEGEWHGVVAGTSSHTISPDAVGCWNGNGTGASCSGSGSSIWGWDSGQTVQWNSGGSSYSCWD